MSCGIWPDKGGRTCDSFGDTSGLSMVPLCPMNSPGSGDLVNGNQFVEERQAGRESEEEGQNRSTHKRLKVN